MLANPASWSEGGFGGWGCAGGGCRCASGMREDSCSGVDVDVDVEVKGSRLLVSMSLERRRRLEQMWPGGVTTAFSIGDSPDSSHVMGWFILAVCK